jgi:hypothetical protein
MLDPEVVHWPNAAKLTGRPEEAEALTMKSASPKVLSGRASKVIACAAFCAVTVSVTRGAALWLASPWLVVIHRAVAGGYGEGRTVVRAGA